MPAGSTPPPTRDARNAGRLRPPGHAEGGLAEGGLGVDPALAGDHEVRAGRACSSKSGRRHDEIHARLQGEAPEAIGDREQPERRCRRRRPRRVCRARGGRSRRSRRSAQRARRASSSPTWSGRRALLGPVGRGRAMRSEQRVRHVAGDPRSTSARRGSSAPRSTARPVDRRAPSASRIPRAAVGRRAAADAEDDPSGPRRRARARAARRCRGSIARSGSRLVRRDPRQARRLGHLDDGALCRRPSAASAR